MQMTSEQVYNSIMHGAFRVIQNKEILNKINVFPIQDGDTGSNLASMMRTILQKSEHKGSVKKTLESVADAALYGARGNSGIIFAQYFRGLSETINGEELVSIHEYANASKCAAQYAYDAVEEPVEGTVITVMREWGSILVEECTKKNTLIDIFTTAVGKIEIALEKTKEQIAVLKKANVVDSGAKGFTYFVEGVLYYMENGELLDSKEFRVDEDEVFEGENFIQDMDHNGSEGFRYCTECLLENDYINLVELKAKLKKMGNSTVVAGSEKKCRVHIHTNEPAKVFDYLHESGTILYQKVDDMYKQEAIVNHRKHDIALVTDSIADLSQEFIDDHQIQIIHLDILYKDITFLDKLTIEPWRLLELISNDKKLPISSQPNPKYIENLMDYLTTYYKSVIVMTVSKELSGTYNNFLNFIKNNSDKGYRINIINTKQNSGAQGLLVKKCAEDIEEGKSHEEIVNHIESLVEESKILVQVRSIDNMIKGGRLSVRAGSLAKKAGMKPIVTLDKDGKGTLDGIAFSTKGSNKKLIKHIKKVLNTRKIQEYNIVHVNNESGAKELAQLMTKLIGREPVYITETSSIVAISAGEGAVAVSYLLEKEVS